MKKFALGLLLLIGSMTMEALPLGNPSEPNFLPEGVVLASFGGRSDPCCVWFPVSFRVGFYGDFVFDRKLRLRENQRDVIHSTQIFTNAGCFVFNVANRLDIFATAGVSNIKISQIEETWGTSIFVSDDSIGFLETNTNFSWSVGARATLLQGYGFTFGAEGQYFQIRPKLNRYYSPFLTATVVYFDEDNTVTYREWQGGIALSYAITCRNPLWKIIPYGGLKWSWARLDTHNFVITITDLIAVTRTLTIFDLQAQRSFGYALGVTLTAWGNSAFTLEGRWSNEKALYFNGQFRF